MKMCYYRYTFELLDKRDGNTCTYIFIHTENYTGEIIAADMQCFMPTACVLDIYQLHIRYGSNTHNLRVENKLPILGMSIEIWHSP